jgi:hypothetical protein
MGFAALDPSYFLCLHRSDHVTKVLVGWVERCETHRAGTAPQHLPLIGSAQ